MSDTDETPEAVRFRRWFCCPLAHLCNTPPIEHDARDANGAPKCPVHGVQMKMFFNPRVSP